MREVEGFVKELIKVVACFEVSQSLWWNLDTMTLSLLLVFGGCEEDEEKSDDDEFGVLLEVREGRRERVRENIFVQTKLENGKSREVRIHEVI